MQHQPNLLTTEEREQERRALELVLAGAIRALEILPEDSRWLRCFRETRNVMRAQIALYDEDES